MYLVQQYMTPNPICLKSTDHLFLARKTMKQHKIRHIPIIDSSTGHFCGILTQKAILASAFNTVNEKGIQNLQREEEGIQIKQVVETTSTNIQRTTPLVVAARYFRDNKNGCIVVLEKHKVVGILTSSDFVKFSLHILSNM